MAVLPPAWLPEPWLEACSEPLSPSPEPDALPVLPWLPELHELESLELESLELELLVLELLELLSLPEAPELLELGGGGVEGVVGGWGWVGLLALGQPASSRHRHARPASLSGSDELLLNNFIGSD